MVVVLVHHEQVDGVLDAGGGFEGLVGGGGMGGFEAERGEHGGQKTSDELVVGGQQSDATDDGSMLGWAWLTSDDWAGDEREGDGKG